MLSGRALLKECENYRGYCRKLQAIHDKMAVLDAWKKSVSSPSIVRHKGYSGRDRVLEKICEYDELVEEEKRWRGKIELVEKSVHAFPDGDLLWMLWVEKLTIKEMAVICGMNDAQVRVCLKEVKRQVGKE